MINVFTSQAFALPAKSPQPPNDTVAAEIQESAAKLGGHQPPAAGTDIDSMPADRGSLDLRVDQIERKFRVYMDDVKRRGEGHDEQESSFGYKVGIRPDFSFAIYWLRKLASPLSTKRMLDVGSGPGYFQLIMRDLGKPIEGLEPNPELAELSRGQGLTVWDGSLQEPPAELLRDPYDITFAFNVFMWLKDAEGERSRQAKVQGLSKMAALTKPGGWTFLFDAHDFNFSPEELAAAGYRNATPSEIINEDVLFLQRDNSVRLTPEPPLEVASPKGQVSDSNTASFPGIRLISKALIAVLAFGLIPDFWSQTAQTKPPARPGATAPAPENLRSQRLMTRAEIDTVAGFLEEYVQWRIEEISLLSLTAKAERWESDPFVAEFLNSFSADRFDGYLQGAEYAPSFDRVIPMLDRPERGQPGIPHALYTEQGYGIYQIFKSDGKSLRSDAIMISTPDGRFLIEKTGDQPYTFKITPLSVDRGTEAFYHRLAITDPAKVLADFDALATRPWGPEVILKAAESLPVEAVRMLIDDPAARAQSLRQMLQKTSHPMLPSILDIASSHYPKAIKLRMALLIDMMRFTPVDNYLKELAPGDPAFQERLEKEGMSLDVVAAVAGDENRLVHFLQWTLKQSKEEGQRPKGYLSIVQYLKDHHQPLSVELHGELVLPSQDDQAEVSMAIVLGFEYLPELAKLRDEQRFHITVYFTDNIIAAMQKIARERPNDSATQQYVASQTRLAQSGGARFDAMTMIGENADGTLEDMVILQPAGLKSEAALADAIVHEMAHLQLIFQHLDAWRAGTYPSSIAANEIEACDLTIKALEAAVTDPKLQKAEPIMVKGLQGSEGIDRETSAREMWRKLLPVSPLPHAGVDREGVRRQIRDLFPEGQAPDTKNHKGSTFWELTAPVSALAFGVLQGIKLLIAHHEIVAQAGRHLAHLFLAIPGGPVHALILLASMIGAGVMYLGVNLPPRSDPKVSRRLHAARATWSSISTYGIFTPAELKDRRIQVPQSADDPDKEPRPWVNANVFYPAAPPITRRDRGQAAEKALWEPASGALQVVMERPMDKADNLINKPEHELREILEARAAASAILIADIDRLDPSDQRSLHYVPSFQRDPSDPYEINLTKGIPHQAIVMLIVPAWMDTLARDAFPDVRVISVGNIEELGTISRSVDEGFISVFKDQTLSLTVPNFHQALVNEVFSSNERDHVLVYAMRFPSDTDELAQPSPAPENAPAAPELYSNSTVADEGRRLAVPFKGINPVAIWDYTEDQLRAMVALLNYPAEALLHDFQILPAESEEYQLTVAALSLNGNLETYRRAYSLYDGLAKSPGKQHDLVNILRNMQIFASMTALPAGETKFKYVNRKTFEGRTNNSISTIDRAAADHPGDQPFVIGDVAVADGTSSLELARHYEGRNVQVIGYDRAFSMYRHVVDDQTVIYFDSLGKIVQQVHQNHLLVRARMREEDVRAIEGAWGTSKWDPVAMERISLLNPEAEEYARRHPDRLRFEIHDVFQPMTRQHHFIRVLGLLNRGEYSYFSERTIKRALRQLARALYNGGQLMNGTFWEEGEGDFDLFQRAGSRLIHQNFHTYRIENQAMVHKQSLDKTSSNGWKSLRIINGWAPFAFIATFGTALLSARHAIQFLIAHHEIVAQAGHHLAHLFQTIPGGPVHGLVIIASLAMAGIFLGNVRMPKQPGKGAVLSDDTDRRHRRHWPTFSPFTANVKCFLPCSDRSCKCSLTTQTLWSRPAFGITCVITRFVVAAQQSLRSC